MYSFYFVAYVIIISQNYDEKLYIAIIRIRVIDFIPHSRMTRSVLEDGIN